MKSEAFMIGPKKRIIAFDQNLMLKKDAKQSK
jgi:hypothetical protein